MSHFTVLVIGDDAEEQLAPYNEDTSNLPKQFIKFNDEEEEYREQYATDTTRCFVNPEGKAFCKYDSQFRNPHYTYSFTSNNQDEEFLCPAGWSEKEVPVKEVYPTFEEFMKKYCGYDEPDEITGRYGHWRNPNAKWDWYQLGGRWSGFFTTKDGQKTDSDLIENIDFEGMLKEHADHAALFYDFVWPYIKNTPTITSWDEIRESEKEKGGDDYIDRARKIYHAQPRMVAVNNMAEKLRKLKDHSEIERQAMWLDNVEDFNKSREEYIKDYSERCIRTFAVVKDGRWFERGKMGWWACVSDEKDAETWASIHANLLKDLPKGTRLSLYDCHI